MTYVAIYLYMIGVWAWTEAEFLDDEGNQPEDLYKGLFCLLWPIAAPIWILRRRINGGNG